MDHRICGVLRAPKRTPVVGKIEPAGVPGGPLEGARSGPDGREVLALRAFAFVDLFAVRGHIQRRGMTGISTERAPAQVRGRGCPGTLRP
jgi:hypothetical protein